MNHKKNEFILNNFVKSEAKSKFNAGHSILNQKRNTQFSSF